MKFCMIRPFADDTKHLQMTENLPGDPGPPDDLKMLSEGGLWNHHKKWVERMETCLAANGRYIEKENVKCTAAESEDDISE